MGNRFLTIAAVSGFLAVAVGAFAAHRLGVEHMVWLDTGWRYQVMHTLALLAVGFFVAAKPEQPACRKRALNIVAFFWMLGIVCFSFGLYTLAMGVHAVRMIVPVGGTSFLIGWLVLAFISIRSSLAAKRLG